MHALAQADFREGKEGQCPSQSEFCPSKLQLTQLIFGKLLMKFLAAFKVKYFTCVSLLHSAPFTSIPYKACPPQKFFLDPPMCIGVNKVDIQAL